MNSRRFSQIVFMLLMLLISGAEVMSAADVTTSDITINVTNPSNGSLTASSIGALGNPTAGCYRVTLTATPASAYYGITTENITVQPLVDPANSRRNTPGIADNLTVSISGNTLYFDLPQRYNGALVTATFTLKELTEIESLTEITTQDGCYKIKDGLTSVSGTPGVTEFKGVLDGNFVPFNVGSLFEKVDGAIIKNVIINSASVSGGANAGAIANEAKGASRIYNCGINGGSVGGSKYVGGLVGLLDGSARVINCYSYADITGGNKVGGIVGYNNVTTTSANLKTMVMNCMFYGDIDNSCTSKAPIYNGNIITNRSDANGVSNFNYFRQEAAFVRNLNTSNDKYNCALAAETRFLQRFEFFRYLLNSNRELAAWWATGSMDNAKDVMAKWVLGSMPYPILTNKENQGNYSSVVNANGGEELGTLTVNIQMGTQGNAPFGKPDGAVIKEDKKTVYLKITGKDPSHYNFNYYKVQLPYYNDVGTKNYTGNRVVTGWEVTVSGGTHNFSDDSSDATVSVSADGDITLTTPYNFADRKSTGKDDYDTSGRIFNQGAYFDVPEGVTSITIKPHWAKCVYVSDAYPDVVYNNNMGTASNVTTVGTVNGDARYKNGSSYDINGSSQKVYTSMGNAVGALNPSGTVYDNAIVLVGNVHSNSVSSTASDKPFTIMSIDLDNDNEPDYSYILRYDGRVRLHPVRVDFINIIGLGMAQKSNGGTGTYNFGILQPLGWFESTNTSLFRFTQFEYDKKDRVNSPMILQGGVIEQWVTVGGSETTIKEGKTVTYYHVGGNVWFKEFHIGVHQDKTQDEFVSPHPPISVTGGDFNEFYLTGLYNTPNANTDDNAECYINGGRFNKVAGTGMQGIGAIGGGGKGNIIWQIDNADINEFYAGGINSAHKAEGNIWTVISNSRVDQFCGGPKFGDMNSDKKVVTNATNCTFRAFFGAGYGGNSYNRYYPPNKNNVTNLTNPTWDGWLSSVYTKKYDATYNGVQTRIDYQFLPNSGNTSNVARLFVDYVSFSLATTYDVTSKLTGCTITKSTLGTLDLFEQCLGNFYGGGSLGKVAGPVKSTLTNCIVEGNVFGAGYSASTPRVSVMENEFQTQPYYDNNLGAYLDAVLPSTVPYEWKHASTVNSTATAINTDKKELYTTVDLSKSNLGSVSGAVTLTITTSGTGGKTVIGTAGDTTTGNVYGGGDESYVNNSTTPANASTTVILSGNTDVLGNVYGGGNKGVVSGSTKVNIVAPTSSSTSGNSGGESGGGESGGGN